MADISISKFTTQIPRVGATPATPGFAESEGQDPVNPSGSPLVYTPVTIGSPANGLSIDGSQVLTIGLASTSATGALSSTDWNTFNNKQNALTNPITGTGTSGQVAFWNGTTTQSGSNNLFWDNTNGRLGIGLTNPTVPFQVVGDMRFSGHSLLDSSLPSRHTQTVGFKAYWTGSNSSLMASSAPGFEGWLLNSNVVRQSGWFSQETNRPAWSIGALYGSSSDAFFIQRAPATAGQLSLSDFFRIFSTGNTSIGSSVDAGFRLDVNGTARVQGTLTISTGNLRVNTIIANSPSELLLEPGSSASAIRLKTFSSATSFVRLSNPDGAFTHTSADVKSLVLDQGFAPTSGTGLMTYALIQPTINQTGGANGITRGLFVNPTLTSAANWRSIEWSNNTGWGIYGAGTANNYLGGDLWIRTTSGTNTLDVNGTARIRTISNLGTAATSVLVPSATGVVSLRTLAELASDGGFGGSSKWTDGTGFIFRDNPVVIGSSTSKDAGNGQIQTFVVQNKISFTAGNTIFASFQTLAGVDVIRFAETNASVQINPTGNTSNILTFGNITGFSGSRGLVIRPTEAGSSLILTDTLGTTLRFAVADTGQTWVNGLLNVGVASGTLNAWGVGIRGFANANASRMNLVVQRSTGTVDFQVASNGELSFFDGGAMIFGTVTGMKLGTATTQKLAFWNKTPIVQPTNAIGAGVFVANTSGIANDTATYGGYTMGQIAQALINVGILA